MLRTRSVAFVYAADFVAYPSKRRLLCTLDVSPLIALVSKTPRL